MRPLFVLFATLSLAAGSGSFLAGCAGGDGVSEADYEQAVVAASTRADTALAHITDNPEGREELLQRMDEAALEIDEAAEDLERTGSPSELEDETADLVEALRQLAVDLSATAEQIRQPDFEGLLEGTQGLSFESFVQANDALERLREQGIEAPLLQKH